jgi:hypothetical protein
MKNAYAVLRQKELERGRIENEVEALRIAAPLLSDDDAESGNPTLRRTLNTPKPERQ